jgi:RNA polymerase sigma-70 factor (ECF subfamily)
MLDSELVGGVMEGKVDFAVLEHGYERRVYRWLYAMVRNAADAEELTECVFVRVFDRLGRYNPERGSLCAWLHSITHNVAVSFLRKRNRAPESLDAMTEAEAPSVAGPDELHEARQRRARLHRLVDGLKPLERRALTGFYVRGESWHDVAAELGCTERSARYRALNAVTRLRAEL